MRNSSFKKPTYEEALAKKAKADKRRLEKQTKHPLRSHTINSKASKVAKGKKPRTKSKSLAKYKKELDAIFSKYVRLVHADNDGMVSCYTCGKLKHWKSQQNGHFVSRQYLATRWEEDNCRVQCAGCNVF